VRGKIILTVLMLSLIFVTGCSRETKEKTFTYNGLSVTLTNQFKKEDKGYLTLYKDDMKVVIQNNSVMGMSFEEYLEELRKSMADFEPVNQNEADSATTFEYIAATSSSRSKCLMKVLEGNGEVWHVTFACDEGEYEKNLPQFLEWLQTVKIESEE